MKCCLSRQHCQCNHELRGAVVDCNGHTQDWTFDKSAMILEAYYFLTNYWQLMNYLFFILISFYIPSTVLPNSSPLSLDYPPGHLHSKTPNGEVLHEMLTEFGTLSWGKIKSLPLALRLSMATHHMEWASISSGY